MNSAENIITAVKAIVSAMTPIITIDDNQPAGTNWILTICKTYWVVPNSTIVIGGENFRVQSIVFNESITVSGTAQPIGTTFQLIAPDFVHGSSRKVDNERKTSDDVTNSFVYLPRPRVREDGRYDSDIAYIASIRPLFLVTYDTLKDNTDDQQSDFILPMNAAADLFQNIVDDNNDKFEETESYSREEWMNFGDPSTWGNDQYIFDAPVSGVELTFDLIVLDDYACDCDGAAPITCPDVTTSFQSIDTGITTNPGGNIDFQVVDQNGTDAGALIVNSPNVKRVEVNTAGGDVTSEFNGTPTATDTPALTNLLITTKNENNDPVGTLETDLSGQKGIKISSTNVSNSDDSFSVDVNAEDDLELADNQMTDSDGTVSNIPAQTDFVCTAAAPPITDIIYVRDFWQAGDQETATDGSLGWYKANTTIFADSQPASGLGVKLDPDDDTKLLTLNEFGNLNRVTNDKGGSTFADVGGGLTSDGATADLMLDNYTNVLVTRQSVHAGTQNWNDSVVTAKAHTVTRYDGSTYNQWQMLTPKLVQHLLTEEGDSKNIFTGISNWSDSVHFLMGVSAGGTSCYFWRDNQPWNATNIFQAFGKTTVSSSVDLILWAKAEDYV
tara:strand:- start:3930 stop:5768 length:1839 start_codon:yes stop_codon:yes gene_type:complete